MIGQICDLKEATHLQFIFDFCKQRELTKKKELKSYHNIRYENWNGCRSPDIIIVEAKFTNDENSEWELAEITIDDEIMWHEKIYNSIRVFFPNINENRTYAINYGFIRQKQLF